MNRQTIIPKLLFFLGVVVWIMVIVVAVRPAANFDLRVAPSTAKILLDSKRVSPGVRYLKPGSHSIKVSLDGFSSKTIAFTTKQGEKPRQATILLESNSTTGDTYLTNNPDQAKLLEDLGGTLFSSNSQAITKLYPILSLLPYSGNGFEVNYGASKAHPNDPHKIALYVSAPNPNKYPDALRWLRLQGYEPTKFELIYQTNGAD